jgi:hypothetical protein
MRNHPVFQRDTMNSHDVSSSTTFAFGVEMIAFPCGSETANFASYLGLVQRNSFALSHYQSL